MHELRDAVTGELICRQAEPISEETAKHIAQKRGYPVQIISPEEREEAYILNILQ